MILVLAAAGGVALVAATVATVRPMATQARAAAAAQTVDAGHGARLVSQTAHMASVR
jgi:hypothetical protein